MKNIFILLFWVNTILLSAQEKATKSFFWGTLAGIEQHRLSIQSIPSKVSLPESPAAGAKRPLSPGALVGVFGRWQLTRDLAIQPELLFSYAQNTIRYFR